MSLLTTMASYFSKHRIAEEYLGNSFGSLTKGGRICVQIGLDDEDKYITLIHEFLHLDCINNTHKCDKSLTRDCKPCRFEDEIEKESQRIYEENGLIMTYLKFKIDRILPDRLKRMQTQVKNATEKMRGQLYLF